MILSGLNTESNEVKTTRMKQGEDGKVYKEEEKKKSLRPSEVIKAIEVMGRLQGWSDSEDGNRLSKVDELLNKMIESIDDE